VFDGLALRLVEAGERIDGRRGFDDSGHTKRN
jgi:hypothetical protein